MPTPKKTASPSTTTKKRDVLGPIQAKRFANEYPLLDSPANLPFEQIQSLLIAALRGDLEQLDTKIKALEDSGAHIFDLTWNVNPFRSAVDVQGEPFVTKGNISDLMHLAYVTEATIYFARKARSEAPGVFRNNLDGCVLGWSLGLNGRSEARRYWHIWNAIIVPQTEEQALHMLKDPCLDYLGDHAQAIWKRTAEVFLAQNCQRILTSGVGASPADHESLGSPNLSDVYTGSTTPRL